MPAGTALALDRAHCRRFFGIGREWIRRSIGGIYRAL
jgi:hypothetical protein